MNSACTALTHIENANLKESDIIPIPFIFNEVPKAVFQEIIQAFNGSSVIGAVARIFRRLANGPAKSGTKF